MDKLKRHVFLKNEIKRFILKSLIKNGELPLIYRYYMFYTKIKMQRLGTLPQIVNRCSRTGRSMSVTKKTHFSRFILRKESYAGNLPGFKRAS